MPEKELLNENNFFEQIRAIKAEFDIRPVPQKLATAKMRKRIAILVTDEFLKASGDIDDAFFFEACLYASLREELLNCDPLPIEISEEEKPMRKRFGFNPLKLTSEGYKWKEESPCLESLVKKTLAEFNKQEVRKDEPRGRHPRKRFARGLQHKQRHTRKAETARPALFQPK